MKTIDREVFEQVGNALYAVVTEQRVKPIEIGELKMLISDHWHSKAATSLEPLVSEETHCILTTMDTLQGENISARQAFGIFEKFVRAHADAFTDDLKQKTLHVAGAITRIFSKDNDVPNQYLEKIQELFHFEKLISPEA